MKKFLLLIVLFLNSPASASTPEKQSVDAEITYDRKGWGKTKIVRETIVNQRFDRIESGILIIKNSITPINETDILLRMVVCKKMANGTCSLLGEPIIKAQWDKLISVQLPTTSRLNEQNLIEYEDITIEMTTLPAQ